MKISTVVFDFDGTLVDSNSIKRRGFFDVVADEPVSTARMQAVLATVQGDRHTIFGSNVACLRVSGFEGTYADASVLRFSDYVEGRVSDKLEKVKVTDPEQETIDETLWQQLRLVVAHHPLRAKEQTAWRQAQINDQKWLGSFEQIYPDG
jgi:phosphoglycolate phosphatase-like HAD superfamily hydrolase